MRRGRYDIERRMRREARKATALAVVLVAAIVAASYLATAGVLWAICQLLGWDWWSCVAYFGVWLLLLLVCGAIGRDGRCRF